MCRVQTSSLIHTPHKQTIHLLVTLQGTVQTDVNQIILFLRGSTNELKNIHSGHSLSLFSLPHVCLTNTHKNTHTHTHTCTHASAHTRTHKLTHTHKHTYTRPAPSRDISGLFQLAVRAEA